jgi:hypothetical protein
MRRKRLCILLLSVSLQLLLVVPTGARSLPSSGRQEPAKDAEHKDAQHEDAAKKGEAAGHDAAGQDAHGAQEAGHGGGHHTGVDPKRRATGPLPEGHPNGHAGEETVEVEDDDDDGRGIPKPDRWRFGFPYDSRHEHGRLRDPYHQNILKGDYPIIGDDIFFNMTLDSISFFNGRRVPSPSNLSAARPGSREFFGRGEQFFYKNEWRAGFSIFKGDTVFQPVAWEIKITPTFNINYLNTQEVGLVNIDIREGRTRFDGQASLQEAYFELKLHDNPRMLPFLPRKDGTGWKSPTYDFNAVRTGIQRFTSDFRGFIFADEEPGVRLFGTLGANRYQYNLAYFYMLEKDTNSGLLTFNSRHQHVYIANLYKQDFLFKGWNANVSFHYNLDLAGKHDRDDKSGAEGFKFDTNDFLVRPAAIGDFTPHTLNVAYLGTASDGHIGRVNVSHAFYWALGHDSHNPLAARPVHVNAQMAALELAQDFDWLRPKVSFFWSSGDKFPEDRIARGFDSIFDNVNFAGGGQGFLVNPTLTQADRTLINPIIPIGTSFWNQQSIRLTGSNVALQQPGSLIPSLRSSKDQGQAQYVNPGIYIYNAGADAKLTPKLLGTFNFNYLRFHRVESVQKLLFQSTIHQEIGYDYSMGVQYRPYLNEQFIVQGGFSVLVPGKGLKDIYQSPTIYSGFILVKFAY